MDLLQILGTSAMATFAYICFRLAWPTSNDLFKAVGPSVFKWLFFVLTVLVIGRLATQLFSLDTDIARYINSASFLVAIVFITIDVVVHSKGKTKTS